MAMMTRPYLKLTLMFDVAYLCWHERDARASGGLHDKSDISKIATEIGGRPAMIKLALIQANGTFPSAGFFQRSFTVNGQSIIMRGFVQNSVPVINTMYIPK